uniref:Probable RNA polymerase II nuclear localization protein SLC7A6OS n=1 Tax=Pyxicephalus adspersus TaxID=30357 RepID=A0AAV2ZHZ8_PYXAD|nr:TPA: hypothetical protein GDO54_002528 [Pyxicephalus adspersus]
MEAAVLRVKRKRGADPADALVISCKRLRAEEEEENREPGQVDNQLFKLAGTVTSQNEPIQKYVHEAMSRDRAARAINPSDSSLQRIQNDLRSLKWTQRQESRYRLISNLRPQCDGQDSGEGKGQPASPVTDGKPAPGTVEASESEIPDSPINASGGFQVFDIVQEEAEQEKAEEEGASSKESPETITCNSVKMIREQLTVSDEGCDHVENPDEFVYDIYYAESSPHTWIQDILSVRPYLYDHDLVLEEEEMEEEFYEDEDDENEENNWRNDYPDEEDEEEEGEDRREGEARYGGYYEDCDEEDGRKGYFWQSYRQVTMGDSDEEEY